MNNLTLYSIMSEDHYILANREENSQIKVKVLNQKDEKVYEEISHIYAWDSLVSFAKMVLNQDKKIQKNFLEK